MLGQGRFCCTFAASEQGADTRDLRPGHPLETGGGPTPQHPESRQSGAADQAGEQAHLGDVQGQCRYGEGDGQRGRQTPDQVAGKAQATCKLCQAMQRQLANGPAGAFSQSERAAELGAGQGHCDQQTGERRTE